MTFESILQPTVACPECGAAVKSGETTCPSCGASLQRSLIEEEALLYQKELEKTKRKRSNIGMIVFILSTFLMFLFTKAFYDGHDELKRSGLTDEEGFIIFVCFSLVTLLFLSLTILCYFKPVFACIAGLVVFALITAFILISIVIEEGPIVGEDEMGIAVTVWIIYLLFPTGLSIALYRLKNKAKA